MARVRQPPRAGYGIAICTKRDAAHDGVDDHRTLGSDDRPTTIALSAEGPRRSDLVDWATDPPRRPERHALARAGGDRRTDQPARRAGVDRAFDTGTVGPLASAGLAAAGEIDAVVAFTDPIELRAGDTATRSLIRLAVFWESPARRKPGPRPTCCSPARTKPRSDSGLDLLDDRGGGSPIGTYATVDGSGHCGRRTGAAGDPRRELRAARP